MATKLDKPLVRETALRYQNRPVLVVVAPAQPADYTKALAAKPERLEFRLKGTQQVFPVPMADALRIAQRYVMARGKDSLGTLSLKDLPVTERSAIQAEMKGLEKVLMGLKKQMAKA